MGYVRIWEILCVCVYNNWDRTSYYPIVHVCKMYSRIQDSFSNGYVYIHLVQNTQHNHFFDVKEQVNMYNKNLSSSLVCCLSRAHPLPHVSWQEQSGERSQISWGFSAKRWKTNVIARLLIITYHFPYNIKIYSSLFRYVYFITRFSAKYFERCCWRSMCIRGVCNRSSGIWNETVE